MLNRRNWFFFRTLAVIAVTLNTSWWSPRLLSQSVDPSRDTKFFETKVRPVLVEHCYECHSTSAVELQGGLNLDTREGIRLGGDSGPGIVPGIPSQSLVLSALRHQGLQMPPDKKLSASVVADIQSWIEAGAPDPRDGGNKAQGAKLDLELSRNYWAFKPIRVSELPKVEDNDWPLTAIDYFILAKLEEKGIQPAPQASRFDLCRRLYFDLHGLPPTPDQVRAFIDNESPSAFEELVDELLASPRYGERWGQHWLDVVRYAETEGFEYDRTIPGVWRFRDYVIGCFNEGMPIDVFLREQLSGDEIDPKDHRLLVASGFHRLGAVRRNAGNQEVAGSRNEVLTERTDIIGSAIMGLTIGCARCHNHKFDPISQKDYYRLQAFVAATHDADIPIVSEDLKNAWEAQATPIQKQIDNLKSQLAALSAEEQKPIRARIDELERTLPAPLPTISAIENNLNKASSIHVLRRGEFSLPGERVAAGVPAFLSADANSAEIEIATPRSSLAKWLTSPDNPLTSRVFVNRIWVNHFGRGIVPTPNDFGRNGQPPSHPELLDFLANHLMRNDWQLKALHRLILLSRTYRQASQSHSPSKVNSIDPDNAMLSRFSTRRLSAEEIRDSMLLVSDQINLKVGGASIILPVDQQLVAQLYKPSQWEVTPDSNERLRRSVYLFAKRNLRLPFMEVFDQPTTQTSCSQRLQSTHAPQALELLNGSIANSLAEAFADRILREAEGDIPQQVETGFLLALGRGPTREEQRIANLFVTESSLREFALALFNLNTFLYVK
jgi:hypothetical protein